MQRQGLSSGESVDLLFIKMALFHGIVFRDRGEIKFFPKKKFSVCVCVFLYRIWGGGNILKQFRVGLRCLLDANLTIPIFRFSTAIRPNLGRGIVLVIRLALAFLVLIPFVADVLAGVAKCATVCAVPRREKGV